MTKPFPARGRARARPGLPCEAWPSVRGKASHGRPGDEAKAQHDGRAASLQMTAVDH